MLRIIDRVFRHSARVIQVLVGMTLASSVWCGLAVGQSMPNIVYILADDMGMGDIRSYTATSPVNTPNIDRIANAGMRFTDAHSSDSVCSPTRYSLLTGQYAFRSTYLQSGVVAPYGAPLIASSNLTVAELLKSSGYSTGRVRQMAPGSQLVDDQRLGTRSKRFEC